MRDLLRDLLRADAALELLLPGAGGVSNLAAGCVLAPLDAGAVQAPRERHHLRAAALGRAACAVCLVEFFRAHLRALARGPLARAQLAGVGLAPALGQPGDRGDGEPEVARPRISGGR